MLYACVLQQSFKITFVVRKIKTIVKQILKDKREGSFKGLSWKV